MGLGKGFKEIGFSVLGAKSEVVLENVFFVNYFSELDIRTIKLQKEAKENAKRCAVLTGKITFM